jgi:hypothetical protein
MPELNEYEQSPGSSTSFKRSSTCERWDENHKISFVRNYCQSHQRFTSNYIPNQSALDWSLLKTWSLSPALTRMRLDKSQTDWRASSESSVRQCCHMISQKWKTIIINTRLLNGMFEYPRQGIFPSKKCDSARSSTFQVWSLLSVNFREMTVAHNQESTKGLLSHSILHLISSIFINLDIVFSGLRWKIQKHNSVVISLVNSITWLDRSYSS